MRSSGRGIRKNYSTIWEASRRVVSSHGIAARGMDKQQLDWHQCSIASLRRMRVRSRSRTRSHMKRVEYRVAPAENSGIGSETIDLIMVAQALHWFDLDRFYGEARRVLKNDGVLAASAYNLLHVEPAIDEVVNRYYYEVVGPFWPPERKLVEQFADLPFPFHKVDAPKFEMTAQWNLDHLLGYLQTWSSTQRFIAAKGSDPLEQIIDELRAHGVTPSKHETLSGHWSCGLGSRLASNHRRNDVCGTEHPRRARPSRPTNSFLRSFPNSI